MTLPSLDQVIVQRMASEGRMTFADFMELVLYWPNGGYYTSPRPSAEPAADYFTAPQAHPIFGALLALQLEEMWQLLGRPNPFDIVEQGAGNRQLAQDIQGYARHLNASFSQALRYVTVDRSAGDIHEGDSVPSRIVSTGLPFRKVTGCVLSNELLDALPVHRVVVRDGHLQEVYVTMKDGHLREVEDKPSTESIQARLEQEQVRLGEGQQAEVCLELDPWMEQAAATLERGFVLTIDYGHTAQDLYSPQRSGGTLRCYYRHTLTANPYERIGQQDLTAHVDFTAVASLGARNDLVNLALVTQEMFLNNLGLKIFLRLLSAANLDQTVRNANRMGMLELARTEGMGKFKVLFQSKGVDAPEITGCHGARDEWKERLPRLPLPLLNDDHLSLMRAKYPHAAQPWDNLWSPE
jgi:SAM-dependent MidA family methyltransferase